MISLPDGGRFNEFDLVDHIRASKRDYIIVGQQHVARKNHTKQQSLDYWLRQFANSPDTCQAEQSVIDALLATRLFTFVDELPCPESGKLCKAIQLA